MGYPLASPLVLVFVASLTGASRVTRDGIDPFFGDPVPEEISERDTVTALISETRVRDLIPLRHIDSLPLLTSETRELDLRLIPPSSETTDLELVPLASAKGTEKGIELAPLWWLGVIIGLAGSCFSAMGDNMIRKSFQYADETRSRSWPLYVMGWISTAIINSSSTLAAYHFTTMTILAPCGGLHILFAVLFAVGINQESVSVRDGWGTLLILTGVIGALVVCPKHEDNESVAEIYDHFKHAPFIVFSSVLLVITCILLIVWKVCNKGRLARLCVPIVTGLFGAYTNLAIKILIAFLGKSGDMWGAFTLPDHGDTYWILVLLIVSVVGQVFFLNWALASYEAVSVVPVYSCSLIVLSAAVSMFFFEEWHVATYRLLLFPSFVVLAVVGIIVLSLRDMPSKSDKNDESDTVAMLKDTQRGSLSDPTPDRTVNALGENTKVEVASPRKTSLVQVPSSPSGDVDV